MKRTKPPSETATLLNIQYSQSTKKLCVLYGAMEKSKKDRYSSSFRVIAPEKAAEADYSAKILLKKNAISITEKATKKTTIMSSAILGGPLSDLDRFLGDFHANQHKMFHLKLDKAEVKVPTPKLPAALKGESTLEPCK